MGSYILNFTVYTMAMCGLICFALFVYKKFAAGNLGSSKSQFLGVEDSLSIGPRKTLFVIRAGGEKFLIASDADKTALISKLNAGEPVNFETHLQQTQIPQQKLAPKYVANNSQLQKADYTSTDEKTVFMGIDELPDIRIKPKKNQSKDVLKSMVSRIKD